jgi:hypothetical protein
MKDSKQLLDQLEQKIAASPSNSTTPAGHHKSSTPLTSEEKTALIQAINESFELLRINYQHLYFSAYPELDAVNAAKRLWQESLSQFSPEVIKSATLEIIKQSDFLPTISKIIQQCVKLSTSNLLPDVHDAYIEACNAGTPKQNFSWSHSAVYYAGKQSNWYFLASNDEAIAFPVFKNHYEKLYQRVMNGESLPAIEQLSLPQTIETPLSKTDNAERMSALIKDLKI